MQAMQEDMGLLTEAHSRRSVVRWADGEARADEDCVAEEVPVALAFNGVSHAVMLATPQDLEDFALGFSLSEGIVADRSDIFDIEVVPHAQGVALEMRVAGEREQALRARRRTLAGRTGCGLCGVESLDQAQCRPRDVRANAGRLAPQALRDAAGRLARMQRLHGLTGAVHAAAWCRWDGEVVCVREDIGRHNALDKLIGALATAHEAADGGFVLMTSRASYEIACKAAAVGIGLVAAVSAPTAMAVRVAQAAGMTLVGFVRNGRCNVYAHPERVQV